MFDGKPVVISVANQKGGVGKTSVVANLAFNMTLPIFDGRSRKVLVIDTDPQANTHGRLSLDPAIGIEVARNSTGLYGVMETELRQNDCVYIHNEIVHTPYKNLDILPGSDKTEEIVGLLTIANYHNQFEVLKNCFKKSVNCLKQYDYILIDNRPAINLLVNNALAVSDYVVVPNTGTSDSIKGMIKTIKAVEFIKNYDINKDLKILGILLNQIDSRTTRANKYKNNYDIKEKSFITTINYYDAFKKAEETELPMFVYSPKSKGSIQYLEFTAEVLSELEEDFSSDNLQTAFDYLDSLDVEEYIREDSYLLDDGEVG